MVYTLQCLNNLTDLCLQEVSPILNIVALHNFKYLVIRGPHRPVHLGPNQPGRCGARMRGVQDASNYRIIAERKQNQTEWLAIWFPAVKSSHYLTGKLDRLPCASCGPTQHNTKQTIYLVSEPPFNLSQTRFTMCSWSGIVCSIPILYVLPTICVCNFLIERWLLWPL